MKRLAGATAGALVLLLVGAGTAAAAPRPVFRLADPRIGEASGIALGVRSPGVAYVQNDSGDTNRFFALDARTGATAATVTVAGATNVDWEDLAVAPDRAGVSSVWLADIGDNDAVRPEVRIYRIREPRVARTDRSRELRTGRSDEWRLRYPDGPTDAESLAVAPDGAAYVITKSLLGRSTVYRVPSRPDRRRVQELQRIGDIALQPHGVANPFGAVGEVAVTGAAISPDGSVLAVRTYAEAYLWRLTGGDVAAALKRPPTRVALPRQPQGEGIAVHDDRTALVDSEGVGTEVYAVALPRLPAPSQPTTSRREASPPTGAPKSAGAADGARGSAADHSSAWLIAGGAVALLALGCAVWRRRRGRMRECRSLQNTRR